MRLIHWSLVGVMALLAIGCAEQSNPSSQSPLSEESEVTENVLAEEGRTPEVFNDDAEGDVANLDDAGTPGESSDRQVAPLFAPTSPDQRASQVTAGRPDPFSPLQANPTLVPARVVRSQGPSQSVGQPRSNSPSIQPIQPIPLASLPSLPPPPISTVPIPSQPQAPATVPGQAIVPVTAPQSIPATVPAIQSVEVTGVVNVGGIARAIVTIPNESGGRTVSVGDRIANGQVLVKRIDIGTGGDPVVVLEQNGVEVTRYVSLSGS